MWHWHALQVPGRQKYLRLRVSQSRYVLQHGSLLVTTPLLALRGVSMQSKAVLRDRMLVAQAAYMIELAAGNPSTDHALQVLCRSCTTHCHFLWCSGSRHPGAMA